MPQRMTLFVSAILAIVIAAVALTARTSVAQLAADECITKPNSTPPQGSHWYYRLDRATRRQCWYLGAEGAPARARQARSRMKGSAPREIPQSTAETPAKTAAVETAPAEATPAPTAVGEVTSPVDDQATTFARRWPALPKSADSTNREPARMSNSYVDEYSAASPPDGAPSTWPIVPTADGPETGRVSEAVFKSDPMLAFLAGALGLVAAFIGTIFNPSKARRLAQRHVRKRRNPASDASRSGGHVESTFGDPLAAARRVDLASKPVAKTRGEEFASGRLTRMRSDPGHDVEVNLQRLLQDWQRAAA